MDWLKCDKKKKNNYTYMILLGRALQEFGL